MQESTSRLCVRSRRIRSAMNLKTLRMQYFVISYFVFRSFLNLPTRLAKTAARSPPSPHSDRACSFSSRSG